MTRIEQLRLELRGLLDAEVHILEKLEAIRVDIDSVTDELMDELKYPPSIVYEDMEEIEDIHEPDGIEDGRG